MPVVLVIDDNRSIAMALEVLLSLHDIDVAERGVARRGPGAARALARRPRDPGHELRADTTSGEEGVALFGRIRERHPDLPVILLTAWTPLDAAVDLVKAGAADYLAKPWDDQRLIATVKNLIELGAGQPRAAAARCSASAGTSASSKRSSTCAASCGAMPRPSACSRWPARSRAPTCRC